MATMVGCATSNGDADPSGNELPATGSPSENKKADTGSKANAGDPPPFNPSFDPGQNGGDPKSGDPAPPGGDQCIDNDDPGSAENVSKVLADTDDCDNNYKEVDGVMKGAVDVDYYKLSAKDKFGCSLDTDFEGETAGTELCVYARCQNSTKDAVTGCAGGTLKTSSIGMKGCCAAAPGNATPEWDCSGITDNDSADFYISVTQINGDKCLPYKFKYRF